MYYTGAGAWMTDRIAQLPDSCYQGMSGQQGVCSGVEKVSHFVVAAASAAGGMLDKVTGRDGGFSGPDLGGMGSGMASSGGGMGLSGLRMPDWANVNPQALTSQLSMQGLMDNGPSVSLGSTHSMSDMLRGAVERFALGNQYSNPSSVYYSPSKALSWHEQGAEFGAYGFGSQMALGSAYSQGFGGSSDPAKATRYLQQALGSLDTLSGSGDPQAQRYLQGFGASPEAMRASILQQIQAIKQ